MGPAAAFGLHWYEFDPGFLFIRLLETLGLAWHVKVPTPERIARRRQQAASYATTDSDAA